MPTKALYAVLVAATAWLTLTAQLPSGTTQGRLDWSAIQVHNCTITTVGPALVQKTEGIRIEYVNTAPTAAKEVTFIIVYRGQPIEVKDVGTFTQGVVINHKFQDLIEGFSYLGPTPEICQVRKVLFADGTVSERPRPPIAPPH